MQAIAFHEPVQRHQGRCQHCFADTWGVLMQFGTKPGWYVVEKRQDAFELHVCPARPKKNG